MDCVQCQRIMCQFATDAICPPFECTCVRTFAAAHPPVRFRHLDSWYDTIEVDSNERRKEERKRKIKTKGKKADVRGFRTWRSGDVASGRQPLLIGRLRRRDCGRNRSGDGRRWCLDDGVGGLPVHFQVFGNVFTRILQLVLVEHDVKHFGRALGQLFGRHHLHVQVAALRLASRFDQPLQYLFFLSYCQSSLILLVCRFVFSLLPKL